MHYDNTGTDVGEAIEVSGPAGLNVTGFQVVLYNGNGGASYNTQTLTGAFPATCGTRGVIVINYPSNGIQNGGTTATGTDSPDGMALVDASGAVVEFLSYEGVFAATNGPALGVTSIDIGVRELGTEAVGRSLQRSSANTWSGPINSTFGACNDNDATPPPPVVATVTISPATATVTVGATQAFTAAAFDAAGQPIAGVAFSFTSSAPAIASVNASGVATGVAAGDAVITAAASNGVSTSAALRVNAPQPGFPDTRFSELHYDNTGADVGEAIEIEGPAGTNLTGFSVVLYDGTGGAPYNTQALSGTIQATCGTRGVVVLNYPQNGIQNGSPDGMALVDSSGRVVEFLSYEGTMTAVGGPASGTVSTDIIASEASSSPIGQSLQRDTFNRWALATSTFGACNGNGAPPPPPPPPSITFTGRFSTDPALPVGFQDQLFATERNASNTIVTTTFTWSSDTPALASVDQDGVITGLAEGTATFRATAADSTTGTLALPIRIAVPSTTASYAGNTEFGEPADSDPSDDFIVRHVEYTASYNPNRGTINWVSYDLDASAFGPEDRCDCFTFDPDLPASFPRYTTAAYTGSGAIAGFGIDRGHMTRSFDRTTSSLDNAHTFLFSNVVPQASDLNQGPWAILENDLGDFARFQNKEVYIITGVAGNRGTLKNEGKIVIPASTWKVAVIMPRDHGLANIVDYRDLEVLAVNMPNQPGIRNVDYHTFLTTVDAIEALTGYDLLALLPDKVENIVEAGIKPPIAATNGPYTGDVGGAITMSAAASVDPNGTVVSFAWSFGDGATATGAVVSHTYVQSGTFSVQLTVTDNDGLTDTLVTSTVVRNLAPTAVCQNMTRAVDETCHATVQPAEVGGASFDADGDSISLALNPAGPFSLGSTNVTMTATDTAALSSRCAAVITAFDQTSPTLSCPQASSAECTGNASALVNVPNTTGSDNCGSPTIAGPAGSASYALGSTSLTFSATDGSGNVTSCTTSVTVVDTTRPTIACPDPLTAECTGGHAASVNVPDATASDVCTSATVTGPAGASSYPLGTTTLGFDATDLSGNRAACTTSVAVVDTTAPALVCPAPITAECTGATSAPVNVPDATASDVCGSAIVTGPAGTASYSLGTTALGFGAVDDAGNTTSCATSVTVADTTPPAITCPSPITAECTGGHAASLDVPNAAASDVCSSASVTGPAGASSYPLGTTTLGFDATDLSGNRAACTTSVAVVDTTAPTLVCPAPITTECTGATSAPVNVPNATASDVCGSAIVTGPAGTVSYSLGTTALGFGAVDDAGNTTSCATSVTVADTTPPAITCPSPITAECTGNHAAPVDVPNATAGDVCSSVAITGPAGTSSYPTGTTTIGFTAADTSGNTAACATGIAVVDTTPPAITCAAPITAECTGNRSATVNVPNATASDACGGVAVTGPAGAASYPLGTTTLGFGATDDFGNPSSCATSVTVADTTPPVFDPASLGTRTVLGSCSGAPVSFTLPTATDSCQGVAVTCTPLPGNSLGANTVTCTATDGSSNHTNATLTVNVLQPLRLAFQAPLADDNIADDINTDADVSNVFKVKQTIRNKIKVFACNRDDVTVALAGSVTLRLTVNFRDDTSTGAGTSIVPISTGVGDAGGVFVLKGHHFRYNQKTDPTNYPAGTVHNTHYFDNIVTLTYNFAPNIVAGQEDARLESK